MNNKLTAAQNKPTQTAPISVVIPCYNCSETIARAVDSVNSQTLLPSEVLLIEDGTPDSGRTLEILYRLQVEHKHRLNIEVIILGQNFGCAVARNAGMKASKHPFIAFLDADDSWHPRKLELQYAWMKRHPEAFISSHHWYWNKLIPGLEDLPTQWGAYRISTRKQLFSNHFITPTVMIRKEPQYRFLEKEIDSDGELWLRVILDKHQGWCLELPLAQGYKPPFGYGGLSKNLWKIQKAVIDSYWRQVIEGRLSLLAFTLLLPWLMLKHLRRLVLGAIFSKFAHQ